MRSTELWTDAELRIAIDAYLYLLRLERSGIEYSEGELTKFLLSGPLKHRNDASIRYRMRNISFVLQNRKWATLRSYSPAAQVGAGVQSRIEAILAFHSQAGLSFLEKDHSAKIGPSREISSPDRLKKDAAERLQQLENALSDLRNDLVGIGHNRPPEPIGDLPLIADDIQSAAMDARDLHEELTRDVLDIPATEAPKQRLIRFGLKLAIWIGERLTKFTDAALVTLAPLAVAKATNVMPLVVDALNALTRAIGH